MLGTKSAIDICKIRWELKLQISFSKRSVWCKSINSQGFLQNQFGQLIESCFLDYGTWWNSAEIWPNFYQDNKILMVGDLNNIWFNFGLELQNYSLQLHFPNKQTDSSFFLSVTYHRWMIVDFHFLLWHMSPLSII